MDIGLKRFRIPHKIAESFGLDENSIVELTEKPCNPTLDRLLAFQSPEDVLDFVESGPGGKERYDG